MPPGAATFVAARDRCQTEPLPASAAARRARLPDCGRETHLRPPKMGEFLQQFGGAYFAAEGALWRTLRCCRFVPAR